MTVVITFKAFLSMLKHAFFILAGTAGDGVGEGLFDPVAYDITPF